MRVVRLHGILPPPPPIVSKHAVGGLYTALQRILARSFAAVAFAAVVHAAAASETAWIDERITTAGDIGRWSPGVAYSRITRVASMEGEHVFTPYAPSAGSYVTLKLTTTFPKAPAATPRERRQRDRAVRGGIRRNRQSRRARRGIQARRVAVQGQEEGRTRARTQRERIRFVRQPKILSI